jgi:integrase/recombinase XerD
MTDNTLLGPWIRRFLLEYLQTERNLARNTQLSYRDTMALLMPFLAYELKQPIHRLSITHLTCEHVRLFLSHLEQTRNCAATTRNQRLAAIHSFTGFIAMHSPEHVAWCAQIHEIPFKKCTNESIHYLEKEEIDTMLSALDQSTPQGRRDHTLLLFLYNTGARASEAAQLAIADLNLASSPSVKILGKGRKVRHCPLWAATADALAAASAHREPSQRVFLNRCGHPITRYGIYTMVKRHAARAIAKTPSLASKNISPHTIRHTTAVHLLRAGVDINTIRAWLGHVSLNTTNVYAEVDLVMKANALAKCEIQAKEKPGRRWRENNELMAFLRSL